jgi:hypothetical protein
VAPPRRRLPARRRPRREQTWTPRWLRRLLGPKRRYTKRFRRYLAIAIAVASAGAAVAGWRGEDHARVAEERDREAFSQKIALEQAKSQIRVGQLLDIVDRYARMKTAEFTANTLKTEFDAVRGNKAEQPLAERLYSLQQAQRFVEFDILEGLEKDALTRTKAPPGWRMTAATLNTGPLGIPNCSQAKKGSIEQGKLGKYGLELAFQTTTADLCPDEEIAASTSGFDRSNDQIGVAAIFILAAFLLTTAQISSRPRAVALGIGSGTLTFLLALSLFVFWEVT